jgi:Uma2 family endonuclease
MIGCISLDFYICLRLPEDQRIDLLVQVNHMSTITPPETVAPSGALGWVPPTRSLYRLSIEQYEAMVASGVFTKRDRLHLINGFLVAKMTEYPPHAAVCDATRLAIEALLPKGWYVRTDKPLRIPSYASIPEPDIVVVRGSWRDYAERHPEPPNVSLVAEVSDSSLREDREMAAIYAVGGITAYWIVNLIDRQVEVHTDPDRTSYRSRLVFKPGQNITLTLDAIAHGQIAVNDLMP